MAKEAIEAVISSEKEAKNILEEAKRTSKDKHLEAEESSQNEYKRIINEAEAAVKELIENARLEGERLSRPIIESGQNEAEAILGIKDSMLEKTANIIVERIVNANGNS